MYWPACWSLWKPPSCKVRYLLCVSQLFEVGECGAFLLAGGAGLTEVHLVLPLRSAQVEHAGCVG